jgi:hypothetical protein
MNAKSLPPLGSCFERVELRRGQVVARRVYKLIKSVIPTDPEMNGEHTLVCILDWRSGGNPNGIAGQAMKVECAWFTERHDFKRVPEPVSQ